MKHKPAIGFSTMIIVSGAIAIGAEPDHNEMITDIAQSIQANYVFPDIGEQASTMILSNLENGNYDGLDRQSLANQLEGELRDLTHDLHFGVRAMPAGWTPPSDEDHDDASRVMRGPAAPYGFVNVQRLDGNIGYIDLRGFNSARYIEDTVEATMRLMQGANSIIFDLRKNGGGDPEAVQLISSYLFDPSEPIHLNSLYYRPDDRTTEYWTHSEFDTTLAMPDVPVYVLTSNRTFSAAEEFTYNLKNLERATIIGETTGGGAHPVDSFIFDDQLMVVLPIARAINPISHTNWEGTGVSPDIETDSNNALDVAITTALEIAYKNGDESARWGLAAIRAKNDPIICSPEKLATYAGDYGPRHVRVDQGTLQYRREGLSQWTNLICVEKDQFVIEGFEGFIMVFDRDDEGIIVGIAGHYERGNTDFSPRDS